MQAITKPKVEQEELSAIYLEAHEVAEHVDELNNTLDAMDPMLDKLNHQLDLHKIKKSRIKSKINQIMTKL